MHILLARYKNRWQGSMNHMVEEKLTLYTHRYEVLIACLEIDKPTEDNPAALVIACSWNQNWGKIGRNSNRFGELD